MDPATPGPRHSERTCIGCRNTFPKDDVIRLVSGPAGIVIDLREKLNGRAAYVCPRRECITRALSRDVLAKALRKPVKAPAPDEFVGQLAGAIRQKMQSLIAMSLKAGKLAAGYSAVRDAIEKDRAELVLYAADVSAGTREKIDSLAGSLLRRDTDFSRDAFGEMLGRELVGVVAILEKGFADALLREAERLNGLINVVQ